jgi:hypothetical protein
MHHPAALQGKLRMLSLANVRSLPVLCKSENMARSKHPNKEIEAAVQHAEDSGWRITFSKGHGGT